MLLLGLKIVLLNVRLKDLLLCLIHATEEAYPASHPHLKELLSKQEDPSVALFQPEDPGLNLLSQEDPDKHLPSLKDVAKNSMPHLRHPPKEGLSKFPSLLRCSPGAQSKLSLRLKSADHLPQREPAELLCSETRTDRTMMPASSA